MADTRFLDASVLKDKEIDLIGRIKIQRENIAFSFPDGFAQLRLIEECRALNALDVSDPDNFDLMYDITMQMLVGKPVFIYFVDTKGQHLLDKFLVTNRYMNLRGIDIIDEYPVLVNWLVEFMAGYLGKKYPRSFESYRATMSERKERMKKCPKKDEILIP